MAKAAPSTAMAADIKANIRTICITDTVSFYGLMNDITRDTGKRESSTGKAEYSEKTASSGMANGFMDGKSDDK